MARLSVSLVWRARSVWDWSFGFHSGNSKVREVEVIRFGRVIVIRSRASYLEMQVCVFV